MKMYYPAPKNRSSGFTLVELMVVLVILAIAAGMVIPYVANTGDMQVISAARILSADIQYAQNVAITRQEPITIFVTPASESYTLKDNASAPLIHPMTKKDYVVDFTSQRGFEKLDIVSANFGSSEQVTFDELGAPSESGTITLQAGPHVYTVNVAAATGRVTVSGS